MAKLAVLGSSAGTSEIVQRITAVRRSVRIWGINGPEITGVSRHPTPREAAAGANTLLTFIEDADELCEALTDPDAGALGALNTGALWLHLAAAPVGGGIDLDALARQYGILHRHTPVHEAYGTRVVIGPAADDHSARAACDPLLGLIGPIAHTGSEVGHLAVSVLPSRVNDARVLPGLNGSLWDLEAAKLGLDRPAAPCR